MSYDLSDYTTVAERLERGFERYPDCRFQSELDEVRNAADELIGWKCRVAFWRTADDPTPVIAHAVEPVPGKTAFTRDSEAMNAETSAIGRALILAGFPSKKIASADEVRARQSGAAPSNSGRENPGSPTAGEAEAPAPDTPFKAPTGKRGAKAKQSDATEKLRNELVELVSQLGAVESLPAVHEHADAGDTAWLKRQITTAKDHLSKLEPTPIA